MYSTIIYIMSMVPLLLTPKKSDFFKFIFLIRTIVVLYVPYNYPVLLYTAVQWCSLHFSLAEN
jgi:hypothetical protein